MDQTTVIHTYQEKGYDLFWRIFHASVLIIGALIGAALIIGPIFFYWTYQMNWLFLFFILIPLGFWMIRGSLRHLKKLTWEASHLPSYVLFEEKIAASEWIEPYSQAPVERVIPVSDISAVIASSYIMKQSINYGIMMGPITETAPILYILYSKNGQQEVLNVLFANHQDPGVTIWIDYFHKRGIPLHYTARQLYRKDTQFLNDKQRLDYFNSGNELVTFTVSGTWLTDVSRAWEQWKEKETEWQAKEEAQNPELKRARQKHTYRTWFPTIWLVYMLMVLAIFSYTKISSFFSLSAGVIPGLLIFTLGGFLFFYCLRSYLRWFYMLGFSFIVLILGISISILAADMSGTEADLALNIFMASLIYPAFAWIPYFTILKMRKVD